MTIYSAIHGLVMAAHKLLITDCGWQSASQRVLHALDVIAHTALELETLCVRAGVQRVRPLEVMATLKGNYPREMSDRERHELDALVREQLRLCVWTYSPFAEAQLAGLVNRSWGYDWFVSPNEDGLPRATAAVNLLLALAHELRRRL